MNCDEREPDVPEPNHTDMTKRPQASKRQRDSPQPESVSSSPVTVRSSRPTGSLNVRRESLKVIQLNRSQNGTSVPSGSQKKLKNDSTLVTKKAPDLIVRREPEKKQSAESSEKKILSSWDFAGLPKTVLMISLLDSLDPQSLKKLYKMILYHNALNLVASATESTNLDRDMAESER